MTRQMSGKHETFLAIAVESSVTCAIARCSSDGVEEPTPIGEWHFGSGNRLATVRGALREIAETLAGMGGVADDGIDMISVASIGKLDASRGRILDIARPGWPEKGYPLDLRDEFRKAGGALARFGSRDGSAQKTRESRSDVLLHNDATAAAYCEFRRGAGKGLTSNRDVSFVFIRVGEGVNAGLVVNLEAWRGGLHPEVGHFLPRRHASDRRSGFKGVCRVHGTCIEGLISKAALRERWGVSQLQELSGRGLRSAREVVGFYIAQMCAVMTLTLAPARIALGGATIDEELVAIVRLNLRDLIAGYPGLGDEGTALGDYVCLGTSGRTANLLGALELARATAFRGIRA